MTFNPYAPPQTNPENDAFSLDTPAGAPRDWGVEEVLREAWDRVKADWTTLIFAPLLVSGLMQLLGMIPSRVVQSMGMSPLSKEAMLVSFLSGFLLLFPQTYFQAGLLRLMLDAARGRGTSFGQIFSGGSYYLPLLGVNLLLWISTLVGFLLLIVPGVILALGLAMAPYYVVDANMGTIDALKASWEAMRGHKGQFFLFGLAGFALMLVSMCTCVGWVLVYPVLYVGYAIIFTRVSGRMSAPNAPYGAPGFGPSGGYSAGPTPPPGGGWGAA